MSAGGACFDFEKIQVGKSHSVPFVLQNEGIIPATSRIELLHPETAAVITSDQASPHFSVVAPSSISIDPGI